jgi:hypothetical protein
MYPAQNKFQLVPQGKAGGAQSGGTVSRQPLLNSYCLQWSRHGAFLHLPADKFGKERAGISQGSAYDDFPGI